MAEETRWTHEQRQAIDSRGQSLLVSAAAGSGKTAVLVQRIMDEIMNGEHPCDIDRLLVVTFTNAAAGQMREKIRRRLQEEALSDDRKRRERALRQISLLSGDHIETIDRFCREVVLDHADMLGIDPSFRIADEGERKLMQSEAVADTIEKAYTDEDTEYAARFAEFSGLYAPGRTDSALEDLIIRFYEFSQSHPFPGIWRQRCADMYRGEGTRKVNEAMMALAKMRLNDIYESISQGLEICLGPDGPYHYAEAMRSHQALLEKLGKCETPDQLGRIFSDMVWQKPGAKKRSSSAPVVDEGKLKAVKSLRESARKELDKLRDRLFPYPEEEILALQEKTSVYMDVLVRLTDSFEEAYSSMKRERGKADFSDVSHWALKVILEENEDGSPVLDADGNFVPTKQAAEYAEHFQEIYVDEYQDSNLVQETLLRSISRENESFGNRFLVGDVKQSIYRFRMAEPGIFVEKARLWPQTGDAPQRRIDLHKNFRSRGCVIDAVNLIFSQIMRREIGGVEYDESQTLLQGFPFPEDTDEFVPELMLIEKSDVPDARDSAEAEAEAVAQRIMQLIGRQSVYDKDRNEYRPAGYGDIAILLRTSRGWAETFSRVLSEHGIPNRAGANTGYFDSPEVRTVISYLHVLDNPRQDIPLAASLRSEIGHFTDNDLAKMRSFTKDGSFYDCALRYMNEGPDEVIRSKLRKFADMTARLREAVSDTPVHILLWRIYDETGFADAVTASEGGIQRRANLDLLADKAIDYEATSYRGLFHFIRYIEKLRKGAIDFGQAQSPGEDEDRVRIMTMHASKGLEFPIVFVSGLHKRHNLQDARGTLALHERLGAGMDYTDPDRRVRMPNRINGVISGQIRCDSVGEELRVLYVAMTRAEEKLILSGCVDDLETYISRMAAKRAWPAEKFSGNDILSAQCMLDWVVWGLLRHRQENEFFSSPEWGLPDAACGSVGSMPGKIKILTGEDVFSETYRGKSEEDRRILRLSDIDPDKVYDARLHARFARMLGEGYKHEDLSGMPGKVSVSELKSAGYAAELGRIDEESGRLDGYDAGLSNTDGVTEDSDTWPDAAEKRPETESGSAGSDKGTGRAAAGTEIPTPMFMREGTKSLSGAERGTAYHEALAAIDFRQTPYPGQSAALLETMVKCDRIQEEEADAVDPAKIDTFMASSLAQRMRKAASVGQLFREQPFVIGKKGNLIRDDWSRDETVLIQGIIDAYFIEDGHIILVDYKTDRAKPGDEESLVRRYRTQFELYREALERLLGMKVTEAWLYSLTLGKAISVGLAKQ